MKTLILALFALVVIVQTESGELLYPTDKCTIAEYGKVKVLECKVETYCKNDNSTPWVRDPSYAYTATGPTGNSWKDECVTMNARAQLSEVEDA